MSGQIAAFNVIPRFGLDATRSDTYIEGSDNLRRENCKEDLRTLCLTFPGRVVEIVNEHVPVVRVDFGGGVARVMPSLVPDLRVGEYVNVYGGVVVEKTSLEEHQDTIRWFREMAESVEFSELEGEPRAPAQP